MISMLKSSTIDGCKLSTGGCFFLKTILELEKKLAILHGKIYTVFNNAIFKNYLKEARWGFPMR